MLTVLHSEKVPAEMLTVADLLPDSEHTVSMLVANGGGAGVATGGAFSGSG